VADGPNGHFVNDTVYYIKTGYDYCMANSQNFKNCYIESAQDFHDLLYPVVHPAVRAFQILNHMPTLQPYCPPPPLAREPSAVTRSSSNIYRDVPSKEFKSAKEVGKYVSCYIDPEYLGYYNGTRTEPGVKSDIAMAGEIFGGDFVPSEDGRNIPTGIQPYFSTMLTCLMMKESHFNFTLKSSRGAVGISQFMPGTLLLMDKIIRASAIPKDGADLNSNYANLWREYFELDGRTGAPQRILASALRTRDGKTLAVGTSALYMRQIIDTFTHALYSSGKLKRSLSPSEVHDLFLLSVGAYNTFKPNAKKYLANLLKNPKISVGEALRQTREYFYKNAPEQTRHHLDGISHCMTPGDFKPLFGENERTCQ
jgi:hypothetical protein